jgi:hypothetical protein
LDVKCFHINATSAKNINVNEIHLKVLSFNKKLVPGNWTDMSSKSRPLLGAIVVVGFSEVHLMIGFCTSTQAGLRQSHFAHPTTRTHIALAKP